VTVSRGQIVFTYTGKGARQQEQAVAKDQVCAVVRSRALAILRRAASFCRVVAAITPPFDADRSRIDGRLPAMSGRTPSQAYSVDPRGCGGRQTAGQPVVVRPAVATAEALPVGQRVGIDPAILQHALAVLRPAQVAFDAGLGIPARSRQMMGASSTLGCEFA
jgi:hypothetical protein